MVKGFHSIFPQERRPQNHKKQLRHNNYYLAVKVYNVLLLKYIPPSI